MRPTHVVEQTFDSIEAGYDAKGNVAIEKLECFGVVHEKGSGRLTPEPSIID
jgi:hypothetical protein